MPDHTQPCRHSRTDGQVFCVKCGEKIHEGSPSVLDNKKKKLGPHMDKHNYLFEAEPLFVKLAKDTVEESKEKVILNEFL